jgi:phospholipid/cholesterol/gamma-HCH transport system substrate-binding protein
MLKEGDEFVLTQSSIQLEDLIGKFLVSGGPSKSSDAQDGGAKPTEPRPAEQKPENKPQH